MSCFFDGTKGHKHPEYKTIKEEPWEPKRTGKPPKNLSNTKKTKKNREDQ